MRETIRTAFAEDGLMNEIRSEGRLAAARLTLAQRGGDISVAVAVPEEFEHADEDESAAALQEGDGEEGGHHDFLDDDSEPLDGMSLDDFLANLDI